MEIIFVCQKPYFRLISVSFQFQSNKDRKILRVDNQWNKAFLCDVHREIEECKCKQIKIHHKKLKKHRCNQNLIDFCSLETCKLRRCENLKILGKYCPQLEHLLIDETARCSETCNHKFHNINYNEWLNVFSILMHLCCALKPRHNWVLVFFATYYHLTNYHKYLIECKNLATTMIKKHEQFKDNEIYIQFQKKCNINGHEFEKTLRLYC